MAEFAGWFGDKALSIGGKVISLEDWTNAKVTSCKKSYGEFTQIKFPKYVASYRKKQRCVTRNTKAIFCRLIFALHGCVAIWRVVDVTKRKEFFALGLPILLLLAEVPLTVRFTKKGEWKW